MRVEKTGLCTIGELARRSGVPVKTIRHYSDVGVLPPSGVTEAGYRLYSEADRSRLELVRTLRAADFDLPTIRRLVEEGDDPSEALRLQMGAVELQLRTLKRRRALLESALDGGEEAALSYPDRARALGLLDAREREAFLGENMERLLDGIPVDPDVRAWFWRQAVSGMPEELTEEQLEAWIELAKLASDESFIQKVQEQARPFWEAEERPDLAELQEVTEGALREAVVATKEGRPPTGEREQRVVEGWLEANARAMNRAADQDFARWMLAHHERTYDPRMERYWCLISTLKQLDFDSTRAEAYGWLIEGLRWRVVKGGAGGDL